MGARGGLISIHSYHKCRAIPTTRKQAQLMRCSAMSLGMVAWWLPISSKLFSLRQPPRPGNAVATHMEICKQLISNLTKAEFSTPLLVLELMDGFQNEIFQASPLAQPYLEHISSGKQVGPVPPCPAAAQPASENGGLDLAPEIRPVVCLNSTFTSRLNRAAHFDGRVKSCLPITWLLRHPDAYSPH